jgi:hypothetical protein
MNIRKFISFRLFTMLLMLCIASCSLNKDSLLNNNKADNNYGKHLAHSGKFGRCSLCNNLALASQSTDSAVQPLAVQPVEQEQIFASNAAQENIILKPSKYNLAESFENFENSSSIGEKESESIINKKSSSYKFQQQSKPESIPLLILFFLVPLFLLIAPITLIYLIVKAIKSRKVKKSAKQKAEIFAILGLILAIMTLVFVIGSA